MPISLISDERLQLLPESKRETFLFCADATVVAAIGFKVSLDELEIEIEIVSLQVFKVLTKLFSPVIVAPATPIGSQTTKTSDYDLVDKIMSSGLIVSRTWLIRNLHFCQVPDNRGFCQVRQMVKDTT
jgi:hypothetical protein